MLNEKEFTVSRPTAALVVAAALLALVGVPTAGASTVPLPTPAEVLTLSPVSGYIQDALQGDVCLSPNTCTPVDYPPFWTAAGVSAVDAAIRLAVSASDTQAVVFGYSNGAQVAAQWLKEHAADPDAPSPEKLSFVLIGNATRAYGGANVPAGETMAQTQYHVIDVAREYDLASDVPNGPFNILAGANALAGLIVLHDYRQVDVDDPANTVWTEGNTTYVFVPTKNLPLLEPLRWIGLSALADELNGPMKAVVEQGYDRSYLPHPMPTPAPIADTADVPDADVSSASSTVRAATGATTGPSEPAPTAGTAPVAKKTTTEAPPSGVRTRVKKVSLPSSEPQPNDAGTPSSATAPTTHSPTADGSEVEPATVGAGQTSTRNGSQTATESGVRGPTADSGGGAAGDG